MFRFFYIIFLLLKYFFIYYLSIFGLYKKPKPKFIKSFFEEAGGAFIKFGQILALRIDILPKEYSLDLIELFDHVKPFSDEDVQRIFYEELGVTPKKIFKVFEKTPFASASFAQVHAAKLNNGNVVAVKIQRPGIWEKVKVDFFLIDILAFFADLFFKIEALPWREFAQEFKSWTTKELDYLLEAENMQKIYDNATMQNIKDVVIPKTYHRLTTKKVLVQDYIDGVPLSRVLKEMRRGDLNADKLMKMGIDIKKTSHTLTQEIMRQYFIDGFFHADPHPGNILLLNNGRIGLIDFGIVGETAPKRHAFMKFILAGANNNYEEVGYNFLQFAGSNLEQIIGSILPASINQEKINDFMKILSKHFLQYCKQIEKQTKKDLEVMKIDYTTMIMQTLKFVNRYQIKLPKQMIIFIRCLSVISFLSKEMDYHYKATNEVIQFFEKYSDEVILKKDVGYIPYKRMNREEALERLNNWLAYLAETDSKLYEIVNGYISKYN